MLRFFSFSSLFIGYKETFFSPPLPTKMKPQHADDQSGSPAVARYAASERTRISTDSQLYI